MAKPTIFVVILKSDIWPRNQCFVLMTPIKINKRLLQKKGFLPYDE